MQENYEAVKHCWVVGAVWNWNQIGPDGKYRQALRLMIELQDENKKKIAEEVQNVILQISNEMLTVDEMRRLRASEDVQAKIPNAIADLKKHYAGYIERAF
ncbi:MAG: hypothetical protein JRG97_03875 [Deltaproteobacteria bacterium]|nr:hypothetical protein [Deltaproteobacteria bacterium]MBW2051672.1 hypothetical protein [Deltaproteobacteria bacterium]MBW2140194.1 hypothetical protein [Deltaproteobacteria bacterium]